MRRSFSYEVSIKRIGKLGVAFTLAANVSVVLTLILSGILIIPGASKSGSIDEKRGHSQSSITRVVTNAFGGTY